MISEDIIGQGVVEEAIFLKRGSRWGSRRAPSQERTRMSLSRLPCCQPSWPPASAWSERRRVPPPPYGPVWPPSAWHAGRPLCDHAPGHGSHRAPLQQLRGLLPCPPTSPGQCFPYSRGCLKPCLARRPVTRPSLPGGTLTSSTCSDNQHVCLDLVQPLDSLSWGLIYVQ